MKKLVYVGLILIMVCLAPPGRAAGPGINVTGHVTLDASGDEPSLKKSHLQIAMSAAQKRRAAQMRKRAAELRRKRALKMKLKRAAEMRKRALKL
ncbi:MAG: hypothetical protein KKC37_03090, partial [Proteobacteria bacterium]|nr:hypothetical protein [Pseudomonadota bacterium]